MVSGFLILPVCAKNGLTGLIGRIELLFPALLVFVDTFLVLLQGLIEVTELLVDDSQFIMGSDRIGVLDEGRLQRLLSFLEISLAGQNDALSGQSGMRPGGELQRFGKQEMGLVRHTLLQEKIAKTNME